MRRGPKKSFIQKRRGLLKGPHEEAEIQHKALRRGKNLAFSEDTCSEKKKVRSKGDPKKSRTNQQPPQRGGTVPDPVWVGSKWLLPFPRVIVTPETLSSIDFIVSKSCIIDFMCFYNIFA